MFVGATVVVAPTDAQAQDKLAEYREYASSEGALAHYSASIGVDFSKYGPDEPIRFVKTNALRSNLEAITVRSRDTEWTPRKLLEMMVLGSRQAPIVGSPSRVADELQAWVDEADVDGFNLSRTVVPECVEDFVAMVVPELQSRGVMKRAYAPGTLRQKLFGGVGGRLPPTHPAARYRR
jgi:alkanesulfonate monooxygenase SsuD/methylene tetrahydromethanopterin reductase-like flavin-dependent oxidoreductase (luciferase family)